MWHVAWGGPRASLVLRGVRLTLGLQPGSESGAWVQREAHRTVAPTHLNLAWGWTVPHSHACPFAGPGEAPEGLLTLMPWAAVTCAGPTVQTSWGWVSPPWARSCRHVIVVDFSVGGRGVQAEGLTAHRGRPHFFLPEWPPGRMPTGPSTSPCGCLGTGSSCLHSLPCSRHHLVVTEHLCDAVICSGLSSGPTESLRTHLAHVHDPYNMFCL